MCLAGEYGANCSKCGLGSFRAGDDSDASKCNACPSGFHQNALGQASCLPCVPGRFNRVERQENCTKCAINTYAPKTEMIACIDCDIGRTSELGSVECSVCGTGKIRVEFNTSKPSTYRCETCQAGTYAQAGDVACSNCSSGYYVTQMGSGQCVPCVAGKFSGTSGAVTPDVCRSCMAGKYSGAAVGETKTCWIVFRFFIILVEEFPFSDLVF